MYNSPDESTFVEKLWVPFLVFLLICPLIYLGTAKHNFFNHLGLNHRRAPLNEKVLTKDNPDQVSILSFEENLSNLAEPSNEEPLLPRSKLQEIIAESAQEKTVFKDGKTVSFYPSGNIRKVSNYVLKSGEPTLQAYYENGRIEFEVFYNKDGTSTYRKYSPEGEIILINNYQ